MNVLIRNLCVIGILSGVIISAMPDDAVKNTANTFALCVCVLMTVSFFKTFDYEAFASQLEKYREAEYSLSESSDMAVSRLNRRVIEDECRSYIVHEAEMKGIILDNIRVTAEWDVSGYWVPYSVEVRGKYSKEVNNIIVCDLGIPDERITWTE